MSPHLASTALIGVDWGLTRLRVYCIGRDGEILEQRDSALGILSIREKDFATALSTLIAGWLTDARDLPVLMCGMIGSRNGWHEAPYSACPAGLREVAENSLDIEFRGRPACIVGGMSIVDEHGRHDVIRGEETQILGVTAHAGGQLIVAPGTHSKWAAVRNGVVEHFRTYMTGEMYAVLTRHSSLGWWTKDAGENVEDEASFLEGVRHSLEDPDLLHALFTVRTRALFEERPPPAHASYLSGILLGNEVAKGLRLYSEKAITLIASAKLARLYQAAFSTAGIDSVERIEGDRAVARGLWRLWKLKTSV